MEAPAPWRPQPPGLHCTTLNTLHQDATKQKVLSYQEVGQKRKMVIKIKLTPLSDCEIFTLKKGF